MSAGVSPEGQKIFLAISKVINEVSVQYNPSFEFSSSYVFTYNFVYFVQVAWMGTNIVVFNDVTIRPPYRLENVCGHQGSKQLNYVRKIVERSTKPVNPHHSLMQSQPPLPQRRNSNGNGPASNSSITPSTKITDRTTNSNIKAN